MEESRTKIAEYKHTCSLIDEKLTEVYQKYGAAVYEADITHEADTIREVFEQVSQKRSAADEIKRSIHHIEQAKTASETASEEIKKIEQRLASIEYEKNSLYSRIGVITYEEYAAGEVGEEFSLLFTSITHQNAELSRLQTGLKENELRYVASSFLEKMSLKRKRTKLKAEIEKMDTAREELFRNAGKQICNSELIKMVKSRNALVISNDFIRLDQERDRMYALLESRKIDYNRNQDLLVQSGIEGDVQKKVRDLDKRLEKAEHLVAADYAALGKVAMGEPRIVSLFNDEQMQNLYAEAAELRKQREHTERQLARLEASLKIKELESSIDVDHQKEQRIKGQLESLNVQLKELNNRTTANRKQIAKLKQQLLDTDEDQ